MNFFNTPDWIVIFVYLAAMIGLGVWAARGQKSTRDYFLGNKNIGWFGIGLSIVAAETSALTIIGVPAMAFAEDISFIQIIIGYVIARILLAIIMVPLYLKGDIYSPYQLLENAFGYQARRWAGGIFLLMETLAAGVRVYVASIPIKLILGDKVLGAFTKPFLVPYLKMTGQTIPVDYTGDPVLGAILLFVFLSLIYTYFGGVKAVIWTDAVQFCLFLTGGIFTLYYIPTLFEGGAREAFKIAADAGKLHWLNARFSFSMPFNLFMGIIGGTFVVLSTHGAEQLIVQRVLACKDARNGRLALITSAVLVFPLFLIFLLCGALLFAFYQTHPMQLPLPEAKPGIKANDFIFPIFMVTEVPHILKGFLIVAILAAAMSSISSALTALASVSTMDFVKSILKERDEGFYFRMSRYSTVFWAAALCVIAYLSRKQDAVLNYAFALRGITSGALLGSLILVLFWKKGDHRPIVAGMIISILAVWGISKLQWSVSMPNGTDVIKKIAWPWYTFIGTTVNLATAVLVRKFLRRQ